MRCWLALAPLWVGCQGGEALTGSPDDTAADTGLIGTTLTDDAPCEASVVSVIPEDGAVGVPVGVEITATFDAPVADGRWSLALQDVPGTAELANDLMSATFTPDAPLERDHAYTALATACDDAVATDFRTGGAPIEPSTLSGRTFVLPWDDLQWVSPTGGALLADALDLFDALLLQVVSVDRASDRLHLGLAVGEVQDGVVTQAPCLPAVDYGPTDFGANPVFQVGPEDLDFQTPAGDLVLEGAYVEGTFAPDGSTVEVVELIASVDTGPVEAALGFDPCAYASCVPCTDGANRCLPVVLRADAAPFAPGVSLDLDPASEPACR